MPIVAGTYFDRYQILTPIGRGGMGEIYLAQDTRLGRKVALKLLPAQYTQDPERLRRFEQEAYAASALNHPNIITIYEIGEAEGRHFIATEFIEGSTLRRRMTSPKLTTSEALEIAAQVVSALAAAHAAGIVHRDIKPENIMIRPDGYVKVLDFGLAKLTEKPALNGLVDEISGATQFDSGPIETPTTADFSVTETAPHAVSASSEDLYATISAAPVNETIPGIVMGTAQYMSPEQARGQRVDARTDIFSFGIVLFEMIAGRPPFLGSASREIITSILTTAPPPLSHYQPDVPEVLEWVTAKALIKDREERYQTAKEMLNDLRRLQHRLDIVSEVSRTRPVSDSGDLDSAQQRARLSGKTTQELELETTSLEIGGATEFFDNQFSSITKNRFGVSIFLVITAALLLAAGFGVYQFIKSRNRIALPFQPMQVRQFTTSGKAMRAAISPDGKYVVYAQSGAGKQSLFVRQVTASNSVEIVPALEVTYRGLTFSPDGNFVYYLVQEQNNPIQVLYQVPALGGVPRKILTDIDSPIAVSPDNKKLAFVRRSRGKGEDSLIIANIDGSNERKLATRRGGDFFGVSGVAWSSDGKLIACPTGTNTEGRKMYLAEIRVSDGQEKPITSQRWSNMGRVSWMQNQSGLIVSAMEQGGTLAQVWYIPYPQGAPRRITNDLNDYRDMSLTEDSTAFVTVQAEAHVNIWLIPNNDASRARRITDGIGQYNGVGGVTWLKDGRIVYISRATGSQDVWTMDQNGENNVQLTTPETRADRYPTVSPDGRYLVFVSTRSGNSNLYRLDFSNNDQVQLTKGSGEEFPEITPDGKWVIFTATGSTKFRLYKTSIDGGAPTQLTDKLSQWPDVSPDGQRIACWYRAEPAARWQIAVIPIAGGNPEKVFDVPPTAETPIPIRWMPDGKGISFADARAGVSNIWNQPLEGGAPRQLTNFTSDQVFWFDWSHDGKQLACSRGTFTSDAVLINQFK